MAKKEKTPERLYLEGFAKQRGAALVNKEFADTLKKQFEGRVPRLRVQEIKGGPNPEKFGEIIHIPECIFVVEL